MYLNYEFFKGSVFSCWDTQILKWINITGKTTSSIFKSILKKIMNNQGSIPFNRKELYALHWFLIFLIVRIKQALYLLNSFRSPDCIKATMVFVTDVPMLAPMMIGMAVLTVRTVKTQTNIIHNINIML